MGDSDADSRLWRRSPCQRPSQYFVSRLPHWRSLYYADKIGRLKTIQVGCIWGIVGAALQYSKQNVTHMMFTRIVDSFDCSLLNIFVPIWTSEITNPHLGGAFVAVQFTVAVSTAYWSVGWSLAVSRHNHLHFA
jgi:MFS family permease